MHDPPPAPRHNHLGQPIGHALPDWRPAHAPARESLAGRFCRLEPLNVDQHADDLVAACALDIEGRMWTYLPYGPFESPGTHRAWLEAAAATDDPLFFAILDARTDRAVGIASYLAINREAGSIEVGHLAYSPLLQRTPASTEAMYLMMRWAFVEGGYRRYEWKCDSLNAPSWEAAERLGFQFEGIFRQARVTKGRNRDTTYLSVLDREWPALQAAFEAWLAPANFRRRGATATRTARDRRDSQPVAMPLACR